MKCQAIDCENMATWREVDRYTQQGQKYIYFFYYCDKHKKKFDTIKTAGHKKKFYPLVDARTAFKRLAKAANGKWNGVDAEEYVRKLREE